MLGGFTASQCIVVTIDYRLAPEFPYPNAAEDAVEALVWLLKEAPKYYAMDLERVAIGGTCACVSTLPAPNTHKRKKKNEKEKKKEKVKRKTHFWKKKRDDTIELTFYFSIFLPHVVTQWRKSSSGASPGSSLSIPLIQARPHAPHRTRHR